MVCGLPVNWVTSARYLGVYLESSSTFKCSFQSNKAKFYKAFNCIFGKIGRVASEEVIFALMKSKCIPVLLYGTEACPVNSEVRHSLQFALNTITYQDICKYFGLWTVEEQISARKSKFNLRYGASESTVCKTLQIEVVRIYDILLYCVQ